MPRKRVTLNLDAETADRLRAAAYWTPGETVVSIAESAILSELARLERRRGEAFESIPGSGKLRRGRPLKGR